MSQVTVRNLFRGDVLLSGEIVQNVWWNSKTPTGKRDLTLKTPEGESIRATWNANTRIHITNR